MLKAEPGSPLGTEIGRGNMGFWKKRKQKVEMRQVSRIRNEVVWMMLANVGEETIRGVLAEMEENKRRDGSAGYTSLAKMWVEMQDRIAV